MEYWAVLSAEVSGSHQIYPVEALRGRLISSTWSAARMMVFPLVASVTFTKSWPYMPVANKQATDVKIIVPAKTMALLGKIGSSDKDTAAVKLSEKQILFKCANVVVSSCLVEGNFPKYEDIIPADYDKKLKLSTEAVLSAVRRAALLTSEESRGIKLAIGKKTLVFSCRAPETGDAQVQMAIDYAAEPIEIGFNPQFVVDALRVIRTEEFELELGQSDRPGVIKSGTNFLYVLMPINLG